MNKNLEVISKIKKFYIEKSLEFQGNSDLKKTLQSMAITVLFLENNTEEKYALRDARNMLYSMNKEIKDKTGKSLIKAMLKMLK